MMRAQVARLLAFVSLKPEDRESGRQFPEFHRHIAKMNSVLVCGLLLCLSPSAFSLKCHTCQDPFSPCGDPNLESRDCGIMEDRCFTMVMAKGPQTLKVKNCSISQMCSDSSQANPCNQLKASQSGLACTFTCCEGDLCNGVSPTAGQPLPSVIPSAAITPSVVAPIATKPADTASLATVPVPTVSSVNVSAVNASLPSGNTTTNTTTSPPGGNEPPFAGVPEFTATFGAIFLGVVLANMAALG